MFYPCSENKGADQLRGLREADLRLCFRICKKPVFSFIRLYNLIQNDSKISISDPKLYNAVYVINLGIRTHFFSGRKCLNGMSKKQTPMHTFITRESVVYTLWHFL